jgi:hypothetical protein
MDESGAVRPEDREAAAAARTRWLAKVEQFRKGAEAELVKARGVEEQGRRKVEAEQRLAQEKAAAKEAERKRLEAEGKRLQELITAVAKVAIPAPPTSAPPRLAGKALVVDLTTRGLSDVHGRLPAALRGKPGDAELIVFVIASKQKVKVKEYTPTGNSRIPSWVVIPGYRVDVDLRVIAWPSLRVLGRQTFKGQEPRGFVGGFGKDRIVVSYDPVKNKVSPEEILGEYQAGVVSWITARFGLNRNP